MSVTKKPTIHSFSSTCHKNGWCPWDPSLTANAKCGLIFHRNEGFSTASHRIFFKAFCYSDPAREIIVCSLQRTIPSLHLTLLKKHIWGGKGLGGDRGAHLHFAAVPRPSQPHKDPLGQPSPVSSPTQIFGILAPFNFVLYDLSRPPLTNSVLNQGLKYLIAM